MSLPNRLPNPSGSLIGSALAWLFLALWQTQPALVLADEPTGNLDTHSADGIFALVREVNASRRTTFLIAPPRSAPGPPL